MAIFTAEQAAQEAAWHVARDSGDAEVRKAGWAIYRAAVQARTAVKAAVAAAVVPSTEKEDTTVTITDTDVTDAEALVAKIKAKGKKATKAELFMKSEALEFLLAKKEEAVVAAAVAPPADESKVKKELVPFGTDAASAAYRAFVVMYKDHPEVWLLEVTSHNLMVKYSSFVRSHSPAHKLSTAQHGIARQKYALLNEAQVAICLAYAKQRYWVK